MWWLLPVISALRKPDGKIAVRLRPAWATWMTSSWAWTTEWDLVPKTTNKKLHELSCQGWQTWASLKGARTGHLSWPLAMTPHTLTNMHTHAHTHTVLIASSSSRFQSYTRIACAKAQVVYLCAWTGLWGHNSECRTMCIIPLPEGAGKLVHLFVRFELP